MNERDLNTYLMAKKQHSGVSRFLSLLLYFILACYILLKFSGIEFQYLDSIGLGVFISFLFLNKDFSLLGSTVVTNKDLLKIIENQINRDPEALKRLS